VDEIAEKLEDINKTLKKIVDVMPKESGKFEKVLEMIVLFVGVFGFISIVDVIIGWIIGGG